LIDTTDLRRQLAVLAADSLQGRLAGTPGADRAAAYLAARLADLGLEPAGTDGAFLQRFAMPAVGGTGADSTQNVVAIVRGTEPGLAGEYVALGAHYDHLGMGAPVAGDSIYNGADDDGSGTVALLEVAEALSRGPRPRRSVLLVLHGGEEEGLLGSFYFTLRPTVPRDSIVAQLNVDMLGRNAPDSLAVIGAGRISSELDSIVRRQAANEGLALDFTYDAPDHPERLYYRSDHYNYAQYGIPVAFFFAGLHPDYHMPSDEIDKIEFAKVQRSARLLYRVAWELANRPAAPVRDKLAP
jgi:Zn-dependent M28 family amino/carboxypeptidase